MSDPRAWVVERFNQVSFDNARSQVPDWARRTWARLPGSTPGRVSLIEPPPWAGPSPCSRRAEVQSKCDELDNEARETGNPAMALERACSRPGLWEVGAWSNWHG
jgi:hypothetical protein